MSGKNLTIRDIARLSGVSKSTVSRIISNTGYVKEATREKVENVINELGYTPNVSAKELSLSRSDTIGIFIGDISNQYFQEILRGAESVISDSSFFPFICLAGTEKRQKLYIEELMKRRVAGVIFSSSFIYDEEAISALVNSTKAISVQTDIKGIPNIDIDNYSAAYSIGRLIAGNGHKKIGYIDSYNTIHSLSERLRGFRDALKDSGLNEDSLIYTVTDSNYLAFDAARDLLKDRSITAIQCANDHISSNVYSVINEMGLKIPDDVSLSGFDGLPLNDLIQPKLTSVKQPLYDMGQMAAKKLIELIETGETGKEDLILDYTLIEGQSVLKK
ncbi:MAG: LacI family DNA-binding transcriptional regulator [Clostridia bacterium]|nr:LacI family DNA-binding transcriptional regulator [Clostridia bacterium]MBR0438995.1 LacI family DNA-binding transcriptional regulator [Clostridia bacterium]MBR6136006.1 LacI family DNA-binding transcriptional regulator [Clostridia bacterium]